jgi:hypothetical protein
MIIVAGQWAMGAKVLYDYNMTLGPDVCDNDIKRRILHVYSSISVSPKEICISFH